MLCSALCKKLLGMDSLIEAYRIFFYYCSDGCLNYYHQLPLIDNQQCAWLCATPLEMLLNLVLPTAVYGTSSYSYFTTKETETQKRQTFLKLYSCIALKPGFKSGFADLRAHAFNHRPLPTSMWGKRRVTNAGLRYSSPQSVCLSPGCFVLCLGSRRSDTGDTFSAWKDSFSIKKSSLIALT